MKEQNSSENGLKRNVSKEKVEKSDVSKDRDVSKNRGVSSEKMEKSDVSKEKTEKSDVFTKEVFKEAISKDNLVEQIKRAIRVVSLKEEEIKKVSVSENLNLYALMIFLAPIVLSVVLLALSMNFFVFSYVVYSLVIPVFTFAGAIFVAQLVAEKAFKKKLDIKAIFRVLGFASIVTWPMVIPSLFAFIRVYSLGGLFSISGYLIFYVFIVLFIYLSKVEKMKQEDSIIISVASCVAYFVLFELLGRFLLGGFFGMGMWH